MDGTTAAGGETETAAGADEPDTPEEADTPGAEAKAEADGDGEGDGDGGAADAEAEAEAETAPVLAEADAPAPPPAEPPGPPTGLPERDPARDRRLGIRVITAVIALCLVVAGWAVVNVPAPDGADPGPRPSGAAASPPARPKATAAPAALVQQIADGYTIAGAAPSLPWPKIGQAAIEVEGVGMMGTSGNTSKSVPIASVAKTMTAFLILADHPLSDGAAGPTITVSPAEAGAYAGELADGQSLVKVTSGEQVSERDALEALMLASADNVAKILARWDSGSVDAFVTKMNKAAAKLGMTHTKYTDPSGLDPSTVSTATDQIKLARTALQNASFQSLVGERTATVPVQGVIKNFNGLLGRIGVIGVKTGSTSQAGGCLLFAATVSVGGRNVLIIGAVLGQYLDSDGNILGTVLDVSETLLLGAERALVAATIAVPGQQVAVVRQDGHPDQRLGVAAPVTVVGWRGLSYRVSVSGDTSAATLSVSLAGASSTGTASPGTAATASSTLVGVFTGGAVATVD
jgi:D-alanyl-D-alanine carboxypeptidase (penicillin-binding protein 5/6)